MSRDRPTNRRHLWVMLAVTVAVQSLLALALAATPEAYGGQGPGKLLEGNLYLRYATQLWQGALPYREVPLEYPPGVIPWLVAPGVLGLEPGAYYRAFAGLSLAAAAGIATLIGLGVVREDRAGRQAWWVAGFVILCPLALYRLDLWPVLLALGAHRAWLTGHPRMCGLLAGVGTLTKIFPALVLLPAVVALGRSGQGRGQAVRALASGAATIALGLAGWALLAGPTFPDSIRYHTERGLEVGSTWSGLAMLWGLLTGASVGTTFAHASTELTGPAALALGKLAFPALLMGLMGLVVTGGMRRETGDSGRLVLVGLLVFVLCGKVLSPQYLLWILPFVAGLSGRAGRDARVLALLAGVATTLLYPFGADRLASQEPLAVLVLNARNLLLFLMMSRLAWSRDGVTYAGQWTAGGDPSGASCPIPGEGRGPVIEAVAGPLAAP